MKIKPITLPGISQDIIILTTDTDQLQRSLESILKCDKMLGFDLEMQQV